MNKMRGFGLLVFVLATMWVLAASTGSQAQGKGQEKDKSEKDKKNSEQMVEKEKRGNDKSGKEHGEGSKSEQIKKVKYKPRQMTDKDMMEWTDGNPPGWQRGEKTGWQGAGMPPGQMKGHEKDMARVYPPGWEAWDMKRRDEWNNQLDQSRARIVERIRARKDLSSKDEQSALISLDGAARKGVPLEHVEANMNKAITRGTRGRDIETMTRAMSYGADKDTDYNRLDRSIDKNMKAGVTGDDLALSIYKAIDEQHPPKSEEAVKKPWWNWMFGS